MYQNQGAFMKDYSQIKLLILDCDGVLSDGKVIYGDNEIELKKLLS